MFKQLNFAQRVLLAVIAVIILLFQLYKFSQDGITGSGWIFAFLLIGLLLLPILSGVQKKGFVSRQKIQEAQPNEAKPQGLADIFDEKFLSFHATQAQNRHAIEAIKVRSQVLRAEICNWLTLPEIKGALISSGILDDESYFTDCCAFLFGLVSISEYKKDAAFFASKRSDMLMLQVAKYITDTDYNIMSSIYPDQVIDKERIKSYVMKDLVSIVPSIDMFMRNIMEGKSEPESPLLNWLIHKIGLNEHDGSEFIMQLRSKLCDYTKRTLAELTTYADSVCNEIEVGLDLHN